MQGRDLSQMHNIIKDCVDLLIIVWRGRSIALSSVSSRSMLALSFATPLAFARRECVRHASKAAKAHAKAKARAETRKQAEKTASRKERRNAKSTPPPAKAQEQRNAIQMKSQSKRPPSFKSQTVAVNERVIFESKSDEMPVRLQAAFGLVVAMGVR